MSSFLEEVYGFNLRERVNIYTGATLGIITPIAIDRYFTVRNMIKPEGLAGEIAAWGLSALTSLPSLLFSTTAGTVIGVACAKQLQRERDGHEEPINPYANLKDGHNLYASLIE